MMKSAVLALSLLTGLTVYGQDHPPTGNMTWAAIDAERTRAKAVFDGQENECRQKFAVTDCVRRVDLLRREHAAGLRQEEDVLKDKERQQRAQDAIRGQEQREFERRQRDVQRSTMTPRSPQEVPAMQSSNGGPRQLPNLTVESAKQLTPTVEQRAANVAAFDAKQKALEERRAARAKRLEEASSATPLKPLPVPP